MARRNSSARSTKRKPALRSEAPAPRVQGFTDPNAQALPAPTSEPGVKFLHPKIVAGLSKVELRAIAKDRGYDLGRVGTRNSQEAFLAAQKADSRIKRKK